MFVADSLYGGIELPAWLREVIMTPEIQRLRGVRLINTSSPSLSALSDARRYTHTLGALRLALAVDATLGDRFSLSERRTFLTSVVAHDLGTPPFGHVFEYLLRATWGWSHEAVVGGVLHGTYRPDNQYHQILPGRQLELRGVLRGIGIDPNDVASMVTGSGPLGPLIAGSIDLDNIDTVWRMASLLGLPSSPADALALAQRTVPIDAGISFTSDAVSLLQTWRDLRAHVYQVLVFDESNMKGQALLTDCLTAAMEEQVLGEEHWWWTDEWLLYKLLQSGGRMKDLAQRFIAGDLYATVFVGWYDVPQGGKDLRHPKARLELRDAVEAEIGIPCSPYVFYDNGTFRKRLALRVLGRASPWPDEASETSHSTVVGIYTPRGQPSPRLATGVRRVLAEFDLPEEALLPIPTKNSLYGLAGQAQLQI